MEQDVASVHLLYSPRAPALDVGTNLEKKNEMRIAWNDEENNLPLLYKKADIEP